MRVYQILRNCQYLNNFRVRIYVLGTLTTWLFKTSNLKLAGLAISNGPYEVVL